MKTEPIAEQTLEKLNALLDRAEQLLPAHTPETDWAATAFRWQAGLQAIAHPRQQALDGLLNIDRQKQELTANTRQFLQGHPANNALLWGSRGTGKSSLIRAMLSEFSDQGLRMIEVDKHDLFHLPAIVEPLFDRDEKFIIYCDDLSFEADDPSYKALKAQLDGSLSATPENVLIYATSNRRHLLPENMHDNWDAENVEGEIHHGDAVEEKISLSERFGLWLAFHPFNQQQYLAVVQAELNQYDLPMDETIKAEALRYALSRGSRSGRVAAQFARRWAGSNRSQ